MSVYLAFSVNKENLGLRYNSEFCVSFQSLGNTADSPEQNGTEQAPPSTGALFQAYSL